MDHAATTAMSKTALEEMLPYFAEEYGNPSAVYSYGQTGKNAIEKCRERIAKCIGAFKTEIYFRNRAYCRKKNTVTVYGRWIRCYIPETGSDGTDYGRAAGSGYKR